MTLIGADTERPRFTADTLEAGVTRVYYYLSLVVTDNDGEQSVADEVVVHVDVAANNAAQLRKRVWTKS